MTSNIQHARIRLQAVALHILATDPASAREIEDIIGRFMTRAKPVKRTAQKRCPMTVEQARKARDLLFMTSMTVEEIAHEVGANASSISRLNREANRPFDPERR
jgi:transcriptional regulator GlxA family with amidase domain